MKCPLDVDVDLVMSERQGVEIDYCPTCRGVWLDRGELDKILDRAAEQSPAPSGPRADQVAGHAAGHVSGEGGHGAGAGFEPIPGTPGFGSGYASGGSAGYERPGGHDRGSYDRGYDRGSYDRGDDRDDDDRRRYGDDRSGYVRPGYDPRRKKRKESWLGDLLDFG
jgi:uncharacterized protein